MTHILHRAANTVFPRRRRRRRRLDLDAAGKRYLDGSGGAAVACLGHGNPDVSPPSTEQLDALAYAHTGVFTNEAAEDLADILVGDEPGGLSHAYFVPAAPRGSKRRSSWPASTSSKSASPSAPLHRPAAGLPRQHARRARGRRQRVAPRAIRAAAVETLTSPLLRLPLPARGRDRRRIRRASPPRARSRVPRARPGQRDGVLSPKPWSAPPPAACRRRPATSSACARSATATARC